MFDRFHRRVDTRRRHPDQRDPRRQRPGFTAAARPSANPRDLAQGRAHAGRSTSRSWPRICAATATAANRQARPTTATIRNAAWRGSGRLDARSRLHAICRGRSRPRWTRCGAHGARSSASGDETGHTGRRADTRHVRANLVRVCARLLALVLSRASRAVSRDADPRGPRSLSEADDRRAQRRARAVHRCRLRRIFALPVRPGHRARHLRGLPREHHDRPRSRPCLAR